MADASSVEAVEAVGSRRAGFVELDERFDGGFAIGSAFDDARASMNPPHGRFLVADRVGRVVGCGGMQRVDASTVELKRMWVDASVRGIGLGERLLSRLEAAAVALGADRVVLDTNRVLTQAISMYTSGGYSPVMRANDNPYARPETDVGEDLGRISVVWNRKAAEISVRTVGASLCVGMASNIEARMRLMTAQDGLALVRQLAELGVGAGVVRGRLASGEWERPWRGVVSLPGLPFDWRRRCRLALLCASDGAVLSHAAAARLHGFDGYERDERVVICVPAEGRIRTLPFGSVGCRAESLRASDCHAVAGLRCVIRPVALIQVAATDGAIAAGRALDSSLRRGDSAVWIRRTASSWRRQGVAGPSTILRLLDERVDARIPRSWFQRLVASLLLDRGVVTVDEHPIRDRDGRLLAALDLALPGLRIGVECQSWRWHATPSARAADARRKRRLRALGWEIVEVWWSDLDRMDEVAEEVQLLIDSHHPRLIDAR